MSRKKLQRFKQTEEFSNLIQIHQADHQKKLKNFLKNEKPVTLELACGRGEYTLALAKKFSHKNFIGIDIQGERLWYGAKQAIEEQQNNVLFLRIQIESLTKYFQNDSIDKIWITFPDPFPKKGQTKKRLTSPRFLKIYKRIIKPVGSINLKTDDQNLFEYSIETVEEFGGKILKKLPDLYSQAHDDLLDIQTYYEKIHLQAGKKIYYLKFSLK